MHGPRYRLAPIATAVHAGAIASSPTLLTSMRCGPPSRKPAVIPAVPEDKPGVAPRDHAALHRVSEPEAARERPDTETRAVAILKSGVVDGMGYTHCVDGSIEAELPQGTLRFASINELRSHLENNT